MVCLLYCLWNWGLKKRKLEKIFNIFFLFSDDHVFEYSLPVKTMPSTSQSSHNSSRADNYSVVPPPIPTRTYKPYSSFNSNQNYSSINQYLNEPSHCHSDYDVLDPNKSWQHASPYSHHPMKTNNYAQNNYAYVTSHLPSQYRRRSQDDDDCSTTTSGSYTLHSIEDLLWLVLLWSCDKNGSYTKDVQTLIAKSVIICEQMEKLIDLC